MSLSCRGWGAVRVGSSPGACLTAVPWTAWLIKMGRLPCWEWSGREASKRPQHSGASGVPPAFRIACAGNAEPFAGASLKGPGKRGQQPRAAPPPHPKGGA